ncbi:Plant AUGMIN subunit 7 protein [Raphanus sativus]|nr:Plant AUGMIN subunit 7 protein [Raphanus sativus]
MPLDSRINFFHGDDEASRRIRMLNDMYLLSREAPLKNNVGSLILVSDHFFDDPYYMEMFEDMKDSGYSLVLVIPSEHSNISESADKWPGSLLFDGARYFGGPERRHAYKPDEVESELRARLESFLETVRAFNTIYTKEIRPWTDMMEVPQILMVPRELGEPKRLACSTVD